MQVSIVGGTTIPSLNTTALLEISGQNRFADCSEKPRSAVDAADCAEAIADWSDRFAGDQRAWRWTHDPHSTIPNHMLAPNVTEHDTCRFAIDFSGPERDRGIWISSSILGDVGLAVMNECMIEKNREGGTGLVLSGRVFYHIEVGDAPPPAFNVKHMSTLD